LSKPYGESRQYSIVSLPEDYYLTVDMRIYPGGALSDWMANTVAVGDSVTLQGPFGNFVYDARFADRPLLFVATGSGGGPALGIVRDALAQGHIAPIHLYHGARTQTELYLKADLAAITAPNLTTRQIASRETTPDQPAARVTDVAFADHADLSSFTIFICGAADMVETARIRAVKAGAQLDQIITDPFDQPVPYQPRDADKLKALPAEPEIWAALDHGKKLTPLLEDFYTRLYADPRLEPFFHRVTKSRAVEKQYNFLQDRFAGTKQYFGEKPFNAHHWMVISDDLFDHREALFFATVRDHGFPEHLIPRWAALHETFRRDIVKPTARGHFRNGVEHDLEGYLDEIVSVGTVCDSCVAEIHEGDPVRMHKRTGEIFCITCANTAAAPSAA
ncbi:MAG: FAD-binding oxidoreductase, partial [Deltaproteobacteria bacterium]